MLLQGCSDPIPTSERQPAEGSAMQQKITEPGEADLAQLVEQEATVLRLLKARYPEATIQHDESDLSWLQRLVDDRAVRPDQTYELQCLGAVLGQVFAAQTPLKWVVVEDGFGRDLALQYPNTSVIVFPMTMISKRIEDGRNVDVVPIYRTVAAQVEKLKDASRTSPPQPAGTTAMPTRTASRSAEELKSQFLEHHRADDVDGMMSLFYLQGASAEMVALYRRSVPRPDDEQVMTADVLEIMPDRRTESPHTLNPEKLLLLKFRPPEPGNVGAVERFFYIGRSDGRYFLTLPTGE